MTKLETLRKKIDRVDKRIVKQIAKRMRLSERVGKFKYANAISCSNPEREKEVIATKRTLAKKKNVNPSLIEDIFKKIIKESNKVQKKVMK